MNFKDSLLISLLLLTVCFSSTAQSSYCNPIDMDYSYMIYNSANNLSYRSGADPAVVEFRGEYYMFVTRSFGYWHSKDLQNWTFITPKSYWYPQGCNAPAAHNYKDSVLYMTGDPSGSMSILYSDDPKSGKWQVVPSILHDLQDPDLFIDDDGQAYMFWGSSNVFPLRGRKLNREDRFLIESEPVEILKIDMAQHGWERFGENHEDTTLSGYLEGAWLSKHNGIYYMQYAAPGTEFNVYADGVYTATNPLGPYTYAPNNPICYKPGGFMNGAGHGSTVKGPGNSYWHFASMSISSVVNWERRLCMYQTFFDKDGLMWCDTRFGDYPHYAPTDSLKAGEFTGWMLLSYKKPVTVSSQYANFSANNLTDENCKSYWLANSNGSKEWVQIDLQKPSTLYAVQINYYDHKSNLYGRVSDLKHRYKIETSLDGKEWFTVTDNSNSTDDTPNAYVELDNPIVARYVRYLNIEVPTPWLAISEIRVFGQGNGKIPSKVKAVELERKTSDRRDVMINWKPVHEAQGYNIRWGIAPDKLYNSWLVYDKSELLLKSLTVNQSYYFAIESFNENGVGSLSEIIYVP